MENGRVFRDGGCDARSDRVARSGFHKKGTLKQMPKGMEEVRPIAGESTLRRRKSRCEGLEVGCASQVRCAGSGRGRKEMMSEGEQ